MRYLIIYKKYMKMKSSKYNIYTTCNNGYYVYNQLTGAFSEVDEELYRCLEQNSSLEECSKELLDELKTNHFICEKQLVEENVILRINREIRYGNHNARITILPTVDCNFKCWYCYENHIESSMTQDTVNSIILFIKNIFKENKLDSFHLDWFGGEPLLLFDEVVYPISKSVLDLCLETNVPFLHSITTNGYLVTDAMIDRMNEIKLNSFQITLDGNAFYHNKTRFCKTDSNTYIRIINNITSLCRNIEGIRMVLRINYTPKNTSTIDEIAFDFPEDVRGKIRISPQIVWQFKKNINAIGDVIKNKLKVFADNGYKISEVSCSAYKGGCYVENMLQFVLNYDSNVYKCTARDFSDLNNSIGYLDQNGKFIVNSHYYDYYQSSSFENSKCLDCDLLPSCSGTCIQKKVERHCYSCPYDIIRSSLLNKLELVVKANRD